MLSNLQDFKSLVRVCLTCHGNMTENGKDSTDSTVRMAVEARERVFREVLQTRKWPTRKTNMKKRTRPALRRSNIPGNTIIEARPEHCTPSKTCWMTLHRSNICFLKLLAAILGHEVFETCTCEVKGVGFVFFFSPSVHQRDERDYTHGGYLKSKRDREGKKKKKSNSSECFLIFQVI